MDLAGLNLTALRRFFGVVSQDTQLFNTTIERNIAYGIESCSKEELEHAARLANAHDFIQRFDDSPTPSILLIVPPLPSPIHPLTRLSDQGR